MILCVEFWSYYVQKADNMKLGVIKEIGFGWFCNFLWTHLVQVAAVVTKTI
ncbi:hypothetical protein L798_04914 [Zootermopsis nevadensis]|uniref:Uncharacterized protein n=1 Tax=Zootermopsis nevadensis TaxID=136037 RepID=A0A067QQ00_ZOONE|nr:hypothetical protein L798_04914 [Zootermopsis nevadensis]